MMVEKHSQLLNPARTRKNRPQIPSHFGMFIDWEGIPPGGRRDKVLNGQGMVEIEVGKS